MRPSGTPPTDGLATTAPQPGIVTGAMGGPCHIVVVGATRIVPGHEDGIGAELDQRVIDLLLDPRLQ